MKGVQYYNHSQTYLCLLYPSLEIIWVWYWMVNWPGSGGTYWISTWKLNRHVSWLGTWKFIWHMWRIFVCSFTYHNGWIDYWHLGGSFGWLITVISNWVPTWISKSWSCASCHAAGHASWVVVWLWISQVSVLLTVSWGLPQSYLRAAGGGILYLHFIFYVQYHFSSY